METISIRSLNCFPSFSVLKKNTFCAWENSKFHFKLQRDLQMEIPFGHRNCTHQILFTYWVISRSVLVLVDGKAAKIELKHCHSDLQSRYRYPNTTDRQLSTAKLEKMASTQFSAKYQHFGINYSNMCVVGLKIIVT